MYKKIITITFLLALCVSPVGAQAICPINVKTVSPKTVADLNQFSALAILENGRIKPLGTFANNILLQLSGKKRLEKQEGIRWLARLLFAPQHTVDEKVFLINNPDIPLALGIEPQKRRRYSFSQLEPHFGKLRQLAISADKIDNKSRDIVENEIIRVYKNLKTYSELSLVFAFAFPHPDFIIQDNNLAGHLKLNNLNNNQYSFIQIALRANALQQLTAPLEKLPSSQWSSQQKQIVKLVNNLFQWSTLYRKLPLHILPSYDIENTEWFSPWDAISEGLHTKEGREEITALNEMVLAYWRGDQLNFDMNAKLLFSSVKNRSDQKNLDFVGHLKTELLYNKLNLLLWSKLTYLLIIFLYLFSLIFKNSFIYKGCWVFMLMAFIMHAGAIILRIMILQRPPVSNLYETFIFVGFISVLTGILIEKINKQWLGVIISSFSGFTFLTIANKFASEGDTMQMLVAVLNSNFWLSTHVLSITIGYAGVCVAGIVGHVYIIQSIFSKSNKKQLDKTYRVLIGTLGFGLTMAFLGTNLGGIWADQSWGRFWGWDPKENGALLIILWTAILFHAKVGKMIGPLGLAIGSVMGIMVVMWAWFGVNLLSIGLHSYGFTSGLARNLAVYFGLQITFLIITAPIAHKKLKG